ncbi:hypothetical protein [Rhodopila sp.]|uniref:hypothetical protein n=1 Tax=Rhodopila sp. TaxID=2480087 RepID=UPI002D7E6879|nr:hypothetical protein [Rhodopila sp.]
MNSKIGKLPLKYLDIVSEPANIKVALIVRAMARVGSSAVGMPAYSRMISIGTIAGFATPPIPAG